MKEAVTITVNGTERQLDVDPAMPLLWVLRDELDITGPKFGCGMSLCGACTVHIDGVAVRSCTLPVAAVTGQVSTLDGLEADSLVQTIKDAWIEHQVAQCGYCQPGQIMAAAALLKENKDPSQEDIFAAMSNLCRCGTYPRILKAIQTASSNLRARGSKP